MSKKPTKTTPVTHAEHFKLRLPSERPGKADLDACGDVIVFLKDGVVTDKPSRLESNQGALAWLPGHLPAHLIPKPETAEERMRREFEEWAKKERYNLERHGEGYIIDCAQSAWESWQAAKTTP